MTIPQRPSPSPYAARFEKVLWRRQSPFSDDHVGDFFLASLGRGAQGQQRGGACRTERPKPPPPTLASLLLSATPMTQQLLLILNFVSLFSHLLLGRISPITLLILGTSLSGLACLGLALSQRLLRPSTPTRGVHKEVNDTAHPPPLSLALLITVLLALSPVLRTLTSATTSDSIWALAAGLFVLNFALADHSLPPLPPPPPPPPPPPLEGKGEGRTTRAAQEHHAASHDAPKNPLPASPRIHSPSITMTTTAAPTQSLFPTLSLNASICASVVLASRLPSDLSVFSLLLTSIQLFSLLPWLRRRMLALSSSAASSSPSRYPTSTMATSISSHRHTTPMLPTMIQSILTLTLLMTLLLLLSPLSKPALYASLLALAFLNLVAPGWLWLTFQNAERTGWKEDRSGDWDVATPRVGRASTRREE